MPDVRLIDGNALVKQIEGTHCKDCNSYNGAMCRACTWMDAMDYIEDAPTIDAQPVKHGHWVELPKALNPNETPCQCSNCKHVISFYYGYPKSKFCDECGAKMDGGDADER